MCTTATAKRRRKQAANGFKHMAPLKRPHYRKPDAETSKKRLARLIATERRIANKGKA